MQLVRNTWRNFSYVIDTTGNMTPLPVNSLDELQCHGGEYRAEQHAVADRNMSIPPGVARQQELSSNNVNLLLNEQSMSLQICHLAYRAMRGGYTRRRTWTCAGMGRSICSSMRRRRVSKPTSIAVTWQAIIRMGSDFTSNYYEIRIPLVKTPWGDNTPTDVWPAANNLDMQLGRLIKLKEDRNNSWGLECLLQGGRCQHRANVCHPG